MKKRRIYFRAKMSKRKPNPDKMIFWARWRKRVADWA